jgi:chromosome segregation ATPase
MSVKKQAATYLLSIDPETERLQNAIDKLKNKLLTLEAQWTDARSSLIQQRDNLLQALNNRLAKYNEKLGEINDMKSKGRSLNNEIKEKDEQLVRLQHDYQTHKSSISKNDHSRSFFTKQILEIVTNTNKQKEEINKTIIETRVLQKDLNRLTEKLERTFQVTDSQLFKDAQSQREGLKNPSKARLR